jgi:hypothetical protein
MMLVLLISMRWMKRKARRRLVDVFWGRKGVVPVAG